MVPNILGVYPSGIDPVSVLQEFLPNMAIMIIVIILLLVFSGLAGLKSDFFANKQHTVFALIFVITMNVVVYYVKPDLFDFFLIFSTLAAIFSGLSKEQGPTTYLPVTFVSVFFFLFGDAFFGAYGGAPWLVFLKDPLIQNSAIGVLVFMIIIRLVFRD